MHPNGRGDACIAHALTRVLFGQLARLFRHEQHRAGHSGTRQRSRERLPHVTHSATKCERAASGMRKRRDGLQGQLDRTRRREQRAPQLGMPSCERTSARDAYQCASKRYFLGAGAAGTLPPPL